MVTLFAKSQLPTAHGEFELRVWVDDEGREHLTLSIGELGGAADPTLCRLHSECLTGEVLGSLKCDCKAQLDAALAQIHAEGVGVLVYLRQEGRGIGLGNKVRAYALQDEGADTVDANRMLGLPDDSRSYDVAGAILSGLGVSRVRLLTNNPEKISGLERAGIGVAGRVPLEVGGNPVNQDYLETKRARMGHLLRAVPVPDEQAS